MDYNDWKDEWLTLGRECDIEINEERVKEITVCVFSLAQFTQYKVADETKGIVYLFHNDDSLALATKCMGSTVTICFAKFGSFCFNRKFFAGYIDKPVEAVRIGGQLRLQDEDGYIL